MIDGLLAPPPSPASLFAARGEGETLKPRTGLGGMTMVLFMKSGHTLNDGAASRVLELAAELPDVGFLVMGGARVAISAGLKPANVLLLGEVDDATRTVCLHACDAGLEPRLRQRERPSATLLDCFAAGLPVISIAGGVAELPGPHGVYCLVRPIDEFAASNRDVLGEGAGAVLERAAAARARSSSGRRHDAISARLARRGWARGRDLGRGPRVLHGSARVLQGVAPCSCSFT